MFSLNVRPSVSLYRASLGFTILGTILAIFMIFRPATVMQILFSLGGVSTLQHSRSMASGFSRYVILMGVCLLGVMAFKTFFLWLWFRRKKLVGLILYVLLNLCLVVFSQYAAINYYGFFYAFIVFPAAGILLHLLSLQPATDASSKV